MGIVSAEFNSQKHSEAAILATFSKKSGTLILSSICDGDEAEAVLKKSAELTVSCPSFDASAELIYAPSRLKGESLKLFLKSKCTKSFPRRLTLFHPCPHTDDKDEKAYTALSIPETAYDDLYDPDIFTASAFALTGISRALYPERLVLHAYADEGRLIITVSKGESLLYMRNTPVETTGQELLTEDLKLTLTHLTRNKDITPELILLSGIYALNTELFDAAAAETETETVIAVPEGVVEACSFEDFHRIIISVGAALNGDKFDFTPEKQLRKKAFSKLMLALNIILLIAFGGLTIQNLTLLSGYREKTEKLFDNAVALREDRKKTADLLGQSALNGYLLSYMDLLAERNENPLRKIKDIEPLINHIGFERFVISRNEPFMAAVSKEFGTLTSLTEFEEEVKAEAARLEAKGYKVQNDSRFNYDDLKAEIRLSIDGKGK